MKIATILFTYNRSRHAKMVLEALEHNEVIPEKLYIFQDGVKASTDIQEWNRVGGLIRKVSFCDTEVIISRKNKGLADSVITGLNQVFKKYDAVIVLEDDCVPHPKFMSYMYGSLKKYNNEKKVYSVGGCAWPVDISQVGADAYFCQRISSCGWGTWKDRWDQFEIDYLLLKRILQNSQTTERLNIWGPDLPDHLTGNITGKCDSWAVFWALKVIEKDGYCLSPYESLITNIGFDGTGVHSGNCKVEWRQRDESNLNDYILPECIECSQECKNAFQYMFSATSVSDKFRTYQNLLITLLNNLRSNKYTEKLFERFYGKTISVWGTGKICDYILEELKHRCTVECIIMSMPAYERYHEIPVLSIKDIPDTVEEIIIIPFYELDKITNTVKNAEKKVKLTGFDEILTSKV